MSKTTVPTEWLDELIQINNDLIKYSREPKRLDEANFTAGALQAHIYNYKYFTERPSENVELDEFAKWFAEQTHTDKIYYSLVDLEFKKYENDVWNDVPFSEVYQAFKNRKS